MDPVIPKLPSKCSKDVKAVNLSRFQMSPLTNLSQIPRYQEYKPTEECLTEHYKCLPTTHTLPLSDGSLTEHLSNPQFMANPSLPNILQSEVVDWSCKSLDPTYESLLFDSKTSDLKSKVNKRSRLVKQVWESKNVSKEKRFKIEDYNPDNGCPKCLKNFSSLSALRYHLIQHKDKFLCELCARFISFHKNMQHSRQHSLVGDKFKCKSCNKILLSEASLINHSKIHEGYKYFCSKCPRKFFQKSNLLVHIEKMHCALPLYPFSCAVCSKSFRNKLSLAHHEVRHRK